MNSKWKVLTGRKTGYVFRSEKTHECCIKVMEAASKYQKTKKVDQWQNLVNSRIKLLEEHAKHMKKDSQNLIRARKTIRYWQYARVNLEPTGYDTFEHERSIG